jgi:uncharacterized protein YceH (UPF0502 family)
MIPHDLTPVEARVLGSLIEKELSTPDNYPLSLNALVSACNQISNRDPVMRLEDSAVADSVASLRRRSLARSFQGIGSRVPKLEHLAETTMDAPPLDRAIIAVLLLRGPQTLAELRTRATRLLGQDDASAVETALAQLETREVIAKLSRRPGQKEARFAHLLSGDPIDPTTDGPSAGITDAPAPAPDRLATMEEALRELRDEVADLREQLERFRRQFE